MKILNSKEIHLITATLLYGTLSALIFGMLTSRMCNPKENSGDTNSTVVHAQEIIHSTSEHALKCPEKCPENSQPITPQEHEEISRAAKAILDTPKLAEETPQEYPSADSSEYPQILPQGIEWLEEQVRLDVEKLAAQYAQHSEKPGTSPTTQIPQMTVSQNTR